MSDAVRVPGALALAVLLLAGCAAPASLPVTATAAGVEVTAITGAWSGWPRTLTTVVTPVRVRVVNRSEVPLRLSPTSFALALPDGRRLAAAPPADIRTTVAGPPPTVRQDDGLTLGPMRDRSGSGWALNDKMADQRVDPVQQPAATWPLPSADMLAQALPEGVLAPGATASGFVYFERAPAGIVPTSLTARLLDARSGEPAATVEVVLPKP
jgi:hypothetical protein